MVYEIQAKLIDKNDRIKVVEKKFKTDAARDKWVDKMEDLGRLYEVTGMRESEN